MTGGPGGGRATALRIARIVFVIVVLVFFARALLTSTNELRDVELRLRPGWLAAAAVVQLLAFPLLPLAWRALVVAAGLRPPALPAIRVWSMSQVGRFVPSAAPAFVARAQMGTALGIPRAVGAATMVVEIGLIVLVGGVLAAALVPVDDFPLVVRLAVGACGVVALVVLPSLLRPLSRRIPRLGDVEWHGGRFRLAEGVFCANALLKGVAFVLLAVAVVPVALDDALALVGALNGAAVLGTVGVTPAGLGVREGVMAALLESRVGLGEAATLAVLYRFFELAVEVVWLGIVQLRPFRTEEISTSG